jgi:hypothetical protein
MKNKQSKVNGKYIINFAGGCWFYVVIDSDKLIDMTSSDVMGTHINARDKYAYLATIDMNLLPEVSSVDAKDVLRVWNEFVGDEAIEEEVVICSLND